MFAASRLFDAAVDDALRSFANFARRNVEIFYVHGRLRLICEGSKMHASSVGRSTALQHTYKRLGTNGLSTTADRRAYCRGRATTPGWITIGGKASWPTDPRSRAAPEYEL